MKDARAGFLLREILITIVDDLDQMLERYTPAGVAALYATTWELASREGVRLAFLPTPAAMEELCGPYDVPEAFNVVEVDLD